MYTDPTIVDGPNFSDSKLLPMIPITARRISGAEEPVQRVHMILEIAYVIYCKAILDNDIASRGGKGACVKTFGSIVLRKFGMVRGCS